MVADVRELRRKAALCRRVARIPTSGAGNADRILIGLAEKLEHDALLRERQMQATRSSPLLKINPTAL